MFRGILIFLLLAIGISSCHLKKKTTVVDNKKEVKNNNKTDSTTFKDYDSIKGKYAAKLGVEAGELSNGLLYEYIDRWMGVPYKWAGNDSTGVDCSGLVDQIYLNVFSFQLKRSATDIINQCKLIDKDKLEEGDLVFFDISGKNSHIGVYLANNKFIHASSSKGVMISDLTESYWTKHWGRAGRVK